MEINRIEWVDIAKGIAILLVVLGHTGLAVGSARYLDAFIYSFHLPLFFVLSGYLGGGILTVRELITLELCLIREFYLCLFHI